MYTRIPLISETSVMPSISAIRTDARFDERTSASAGLKCSSARRTIRTPRPRPRIFGAMVHESSKRSPILSARTVPTGTPDSSAMKRWRSGFSKAAVNHLMWLSNENALVEREASIAASSVRHSYSLVASSMVAGRRSI